MIHRTEKETFITRIKNVKVVVDQGVSHFSIGNVEKMSFFDFRKMVDYSFSKGFFDIL